MFHLAIVLVALAYITAMAAFIGLLITLIIDLITGKRLSKENKKKLQVGISILAGVVIFCVRAFVL
ncbi:hypothetical protein [Butyrivibrio hungatei]|uniref:hypothetical protein n=1 Tax=Butyrivibrio hungatei TaxID=185008 RepID=UPI00093297EF|nr:hypothetical protein [Butyrivibrio hungatei]